MILVFALVHDLCVLSRVLLLKCFVFFQSMFTISLFNMLFYSSFLFIFKSAELSHLWHYLLMYVFPVAVTFVRLMADLTPLLPPPPTTLLPSSLPCGFAVGPSRLCAGRLGLWWVGRSLGAGSLLGSEGDTEWPWRSPANAQAENVNSNLAVSSYFRDKHTETINEPM